MTARRLKLLVKRSFDASVATVALLLLAPVFAVIALFVWLSDGRPIFFRQLRPGYRGKPFLLAKFRTMRNPVNTPDPRFDEQRLTRMGRILRSVSLDELPQLWNVLRGEMSLVGPRPLLMQYLDRYTPEQARRHEMRPGITGWAQINGRNTTTWPERLACDVWYVDHWSMGLDARILLRTVLQVLKREGISAKGCATMPEFMGKQSSATEGQ
jgi:lipopolysaccharide/colanic/teichoic acid biosynthesis glycosyltransferase